MTNNIFIFYEHVARELEICNILKAKFERQGNYHVSLFSLNFEIPNAVHFGKKHNPAAIILPFSYSDQHIKQLSPLFARDDCPYVFSLDSEEIGSSFSESIILPVDEFGKKKVIHLVWSNRFSNILKKAGTDPKNIIITGNPRTDLLYDYKESVDRTSVANKLKECKKRGGMKRLYLRKAESSDIDLLFNWANDPTVRRNSFNTESILYEDHVKWFNRMMMNDSVLQFILMCDDTPIGQIRLNIYGNEAEIGYSIAKEQRGKGYGHNILQLLADIVRNEYKDITKLVAKVKPDNVASCSLFEKENYDKSYVCYILETN